MTSPVSIHFKNHPFSHYRIDILKLWTEVSIIYILKTCGFQYNLPKWFPPFCGKTLGHPYLCLVIEVTVRKQTATRGLLWRNTTIRVLGGFLKKIAETNRNNWRCVSLCIYTYIYIYTSSYFHNIFPMKSRWGCSASLDVQVFVQSLRWNFCPVSNSCQGGNKVNDTSPQSLALKWRGWLGCSSVLAFSTQKWSLVAQMEEKEIESPQSSGNHEKVMIFKDFIFDFGVCGRRWMMFNFGWAEVILFPKSELS